MSTQILSLFKQEENSRSVSNWGIMQSLVKGFTSPCRGVWIKFRKYQDYLDLLCVIVTKFCHVRFYYYIKIKLFMCNLLQPRDRSPEKIFKHFCTATSFLVWTCMLNITSHCLWGWLLMYLYWISWTLLQNIVLSG